MGVVVDSSCVLVFLVEKMGANVKVLTHFMKGVVRSTLSEL
jgi:predicted nucleic acid-binding protein